MGPGAHIYEEAMDWGTYEDLGGLSLPPAATPRYPGYPEPPATWERQETAQQVCGKKRAHKINDIFISSCT